MKRYIIKTECEKKYYIVDFTDNFDDIGKHNKTNTAISLKRFDNVIVITCKPNRGIINADKVEFSFNKTKDCCIDINRPILANYLTDDNKMVDYSKFEIFEKKL